MPLKKAEQFGSLSCLFLSKQMSSVFIRTGVFYDKSVYNLHVSRNAFRTSVCYIDSLIVIAFLLS
jgi:hypothetical protein